MARTALSLTVAVLGLLLSGCFGSYGGKSSLGRTSLPEHVVSDFSHPWHAYPAQAVGIPVAVALGVATLPLSLGEAAVSDSHPFSKSNPGVVLSGAVYIGLGAGFLVGLPFFVLGLPFEHSHDVPVDGAGAAHSPESVARISLVN